MKRLFEKTEEIKCSGTRRFVIVTTLLGLLAALSARNALAVIPATTRLFSAVSSDITGILRVLDPATGTTLCSLSVFLDGQTVRGVTGLAAHPSTGELWGLLKLEDVDGRELVKIDTTTGVATSIGNTGDNFSGLAFDASGTLFGVTDESATVPDTLYLLDQADATPTLVCTLGHGTDGETIAFNPDDGLLYHASGIDSLNIDTIFETINTNDCTTKGITLSGDEYNEALGLTYDSAGNFLLSDRGPQLYRVTTNGVVTQIGGLDDGSKALAFAPTSLPFVDLAITNSDSPDPVKIGSPLTYTITITNQSDTAASNVVVTDELVPIGYQPVTFVSANASQGSGCTETDGIVTCDLGTLGVGGSATVTIVVTPEAPGPVGNSASVASEQCDSAPSDNAVGVETTVECVAVDLAITNSDSPDPARVGSPLTYTITVTNKSDTAANNVVVTDELVVLGFRQVTFVSAVASQGSGCTESNGIVTCDLGTLGVGGSATVTIVVTPEEGGPAGNQASVSSDGCDSAPDDNGAFAETLVELAVGPDLTGTWSKVAQKCRISHGTQLCTLGGTFFLENQGTLDASNPLVQFYLSNDAAFDGGDTLLTESVPRIVRAGRNTRVTFSTALNPGVSASGKFVIAVIDQSDGIGETDELNNVIVFGPVP